MFKKYVENIQLWFRSRAHPEPIEIPTGAELILYKFDACPFCRRVMRKIKELNLELHYKDTRNNPVYRKELLEIGGKTQVPCLLINGQPLYESADINRALQAYAERLAASNKTD